MFHTIMGFSGVDNCAIFAITVLSTAVIVKLAYYNFKLFFATREKKGLSDAANVAKAGHLAIFAVNAAYLAASFLFTFVVFKNTNTAS